MIKRDVQGCQVEPKIVEGGPGSCGRAQKRGKLPGALLPEEQGKDFALEELGQEAVLEGSEMMKRPLIVFASFRHQEVDIRMEIYFKNRGSP
jgi:hypothetical protein